MKLTSPQKLWVRYPNKYLAVNIASLEARRIIEGMLKDEIQMKQSPYECALDRVVRGEIEYAKLTEADIEALAREGYDEPSFNRPM